MRCEFCNKEHNRLRANSTTIPARYCSTKCIKQASYLKKNPLVSSHLKNREEFKHTETGKGFVWELYIAKLLNGEHLGFGKGCDLLVGNKLVDVKSSNIYKRKNKRGVPVAGEQAGVWVFNRNKKKPCDYFVCVCLIDNIPYKILKIPDLNFPSNGCVIGFKSKYDCFKIPFSG